MKKLTLLLLAAVILFSSCETVSTNDTLVESTEPTEEQLALFAGYALIRPDVCDDIVTNAAIDVRKTLNLSIDTDWVMRGETVPEDNVEILVGDTNRAVSVEARELLTDYRDNYANDFVIQMKDNKVVIVGGSSSATVDAVTYFLTKVLPHISADDLRDFAYFSRPEYTCETINGVPAGEYTIYMPEDANDDIREYADTLQALIFEKTGYTVPISTKETDSPGGIYLCTDFGKGEVATAELMAYRKNCLYDWIFRANGSQIVVAGCSAEARDNALAYLREQTDSLFGEASNTEYIYRKDYKMITLAGKNIGEYAIVIDENASVDIVSVAKKLSAQVLELTGFELPVVTERTANNIRIELSGEPEVGEIHFDGDDLVICGGHYVSAVGAAKEFLSNLSGNGEYGSDYTFTQKYDAVPLVSERYGEMKLVWNDEFDYDGDDLYDHDKWIQRDQMIHSDMYNSNTERNVKTENGELVLRSWKEEDTSISDGKPYSTSRSITTRESCNFTYGYLEMRAKVPFGKGCWPSFWTNQRGDMRAEGQDWMSEIDIFEVFGSKNSLVPNIHKWYGEAKDNYHVQLDDTRKKAYTFADYENLSNEYHTYGFYWDEEKMVFSVDGKDYCTIDITAETGDFGNYKGMEGFHTPNYIILNNFLFTPEGSWTPTGAMVDDTMEYPVTYCVDYMRLYQGENGEMYAPNLGQTYTPKKAE